DGRVEPDVKVFERRVRNFEPEVGRIPRNVPIPQSLREPLGEFARDAFLHGAAGDPLAQRFLENAQAEEIMLRLPPYGRGTADHRYGILEIRRRICGSAVFAGITVLVRRRTHRTDPL